MTDRLTPEEFGRVSAAFGRLRGISIAERKTAAAELGSEERPAVIRALEMMLRADADESPCPLDSPVCSLAGHAESSLTEPEPPARVGPFEIEGVIGEGAFGTVYLGRRREPFEQRVAVKVLHVRRHGRRVLKWFEREIAALSQIEHPGIAGILDAGLTGEGQPYLVTEFVDGWAIDRYCRERSLSLSATLGLIEQLCAAVQHAHQRGVVHRDLKPTNVLITERDGEPTVRVIDFGTAKLLEPDGAGGETLSATLVGTPGYLSPEQITGSEVDARTDVYAIGVLLAEIVTGEPVGAWKPGHEIGEASRIQSLPHSRGPRRRDLEHIARTATAIDRDRRYPSAAHIGDDLRAFLDTRPLPGRAGSPFQPVLRAARRHPILTAITLLLAAAVAVQSVRASVASYRLAGELEAQQRLVAGTLTDVVEQLGHLIGTGESRGALIESLLDRAHALERSEPDNPELQLAIARLIAARADLEMERGFLDRAAALRQEVLDRLDALAGRLPVGVETVRWHAEVTIKLGDTHKERDDWPRAEALYERAYTMQRSALDRFPGSRIQLLDDICWSLERQIDWGHLPTDRTRAMALCKERLRLAEELLALDPTRTLSHHNLAAAEAKVYRLKVSGIAGVERKSLQVLRALKTHADRALAHARFAAEAEPGRVVFQTGLLHRLRVVGLAEVYIGETDESDRLFDEALDRINALLREHPDTPAFHIQHIELLATRAAAGVGLEDAELVRYWATRCEDALETYGGAASMPPPTQACLRAMRRAQDWAAQHE